MTTNIRYVSAKKKQTYGMSLRKRISLQKKNASTKKKKCMTCLCKKEERIYVFMTHTATWHLRGLSVFARFREHSFICVSVCVCVLCTCVWWGGWVCVQVDLCRCVHFFFPLVCAYSKGDNKIHLCTLFVLSECHNPAFSVKAWRTKFQELAWFCGVPAKDFLRRSFWAERELSTRINTYTWTRTHSIRLILWSPRKRLRETLILSGARAEYTNTHTHMDTHTFYSPDFVESFAGSNLAELDPASILASPPQITPQHRSLWKKGTVAPEGFFTTGLCEAIGLAKSTFEASGFSQPSG